MSFVEFLIEYYIYIVMVLILLIVTVIGFIVDSKNKEKKKKGSTSEETTGTVGVNEAVNSSQIINASNQAQVSGLSNDISGDTSSVQQVSEIQSLDNVSFQSINNNVVNAMNSGGTAVNDGLVASAQVSQEQQQVINGQQIQEEQPVLSVANEQQMPSVSNLYSGQDLQGQSNQVGINNVSNMSLNMGVGAQVQTPLNVQQMPQIQTPLNVQQMPQSGIQTHTVMSNIPVNNGPINGLMNNATVNNNVVSGVNNLQFDMSSPLSLENVNSMQNPNLGNVQPNSVENVAMSVQNTPMATANYEAGYNNLANNVATVQTGQQVVGGVGMANNPYQGNVASNVSGANVNGIMPTNSLPNGNIVVTTDGAQPFDVASMFVNNQ